MSENEYDRGKVVGHLLYLPYLLRRPSNGIILATIYCYVRALFVNRHVG